MTCWQAADLLEGGIPQALHESWGGRAGCLLNRDPPGELLLVGVAEGRQETRVTGALLSHCKLQLSQVLPCPS